MKDADENGFDDGVAGAYGVTRVIGRRCGTQASCPANIRGDGEDWKTCDKRLLIAPPDLIVDDRIAMQFHSLAIRSSTSCAAQRNARGYF